MSRGAPLVDVRGLELHTAAGPVIDGVDLALAPGEAVALAGASGSGKTTLALALLGHLRPGFDHRGGTVRVGGRDVLPEPPPGLRGSTIAYLGQDPGAALNPYRRIATTLAAAAGAPGSAGALLRRVGLSLDLARRYPHQLSGGQQQRAALAVALARRPRLLILDEPTSALDVLAVEEVRAELQQLRDTGVGLLWITHDLSAVAGIADRLVVLDAGRVTDDGPFESTAGSPASPAARALVAAAASPDIGSPLPRTPGPARLTASGLRLRHGHRTVLDDVSLVLHAGRCLAVTGPSGVGKTTLARCIAGLHPQDTGTVVLDGVPLAARARRRDTTQRAAVQLVPQNPLETLHPRHSVRTALERPLRVLRGWRDRRRIDGEIARLLVSTGLDPELADRLPHELSGGQRQRVAIARALAAEPSVLVCDEVTSALDSVTRAAVLDLLGSLSRARGLALLVITHEPHVVDRLADDVLALGSGPSPTLAAVAVHDTGLA